MASKTAGIKIELDGKSVTQLNRALRALGETDAPFIREALGEVGPEFADSIRGFAHGGIAQHVDYGGIKGTAGALRATGTVKHPGARSMEFGRMWYWTGYTGRNQKSGHKHRVSRGQKARPYLGIMAGDKAIGHIAPIARQKLTEAIMHEWERIGGAA